MITAFLLSLERYSVHRLADVCVCDTCPCRHVHVTRPRLTGRTLESQIAAVPAADLMSRFDPSTQRDTFVKAKTVDVTCMRPIHVSPEAADRATRQLLGY